MDVSLDKKKKKYRWFDEHSREKISEKLKQKTRTSLLYLHEYSRLARVHKMYSSVKIVTKHELTFSVPPPPQLGAHPRIFRSHTTLT